MTVFLFSATRQSEDWQPAVDVYRIPRGWLLKFDLAGVRMEDIHLHLSNRAVTVSGVRRDRTEEAGCRQYSMEITYSRFQRTVELPEDIHTYQTNVDYRDGILYVRIAQREERTNE